ncbi:MFS general substrate transporter [Mycena sp. CBHHK59/15]|nr:MFS general substrate transporter [Mycena sp. CBHHK59/15]
MAEDQPEPEARDDSTVINEKSAQLERDEVEKTVAVNDADGAQAAESEFPDGGFRAYLVVAGVRFHFGYVNAWGVFQAYYEQNLLKDVPPSNIAWIGSIQYSLVFLPGLLTGRLFDLGYFKIPFLLASTLLCTQFWHFILCQGLATGLSCGMIFGPTLGIIGHWFKRKRGLAMGFSAMGSSIGGTIFPIATHRLIPLVGFQWTMRICAFILIFTLGFANLTLARRLPPKNVTGGLFNLHAFKSPAFTIYCLSGFVAFLGLYTVLTYIDVSATTIGVSPDFSFYLVSIANGSSLFGRLAGGIGSDRVGPLNILAPMTLIAAGMTFAWPHAHTKASLIAIAVLYGIVSGTYVSTFPLPIFALGEIGDVGRRTGMSLTIAALGALRGRRSPAPSVPRRGGLRLSGIMPELIGSTIVLSVLLMVVTRQLVLGKVWGKI